MSSPRPATGPPDSGRLAAAVIGSPRPAGRVVAHRVPAVAGCTVLAGGATGRHRDLLGRLGGRGLIAGHRTLLSNGNRPPEQGRYFTPAHSRDSGPAQHRVDRLQQVGELARVKQPRCRAVVDRARLLLEPRCRHHRKGARGSPPRRGSTPPRRHGAEADIALTARRPWCSSTTASNKAGSKATDPTTVASVAICTMTTTANRTPAAWAFMPAHAGEERDLSLWPALDPLLSQVLLTDGSGSDDRVEALIVGPAV